MERFYEKEGITRQAYFQGVARQTQTNEMMEQIENKVKEYRTNTDHRAGSRSLYYNLDIKGSYDIGVSKFERLMSEHGMSLAPYKTRIITTQSCARSKQYENLCKGLEVNGVNQLVVGDLTYLMFVDCVYYLFLLTDVYSARIVGFHLGSRMRAVDAHDALLQWIKLRGSDNIEGCIHHTDGGTQYFSNLYLGTMESNKLCISVSENCLDNAFAEQRNSIIKHHLLPTVRDLNPKRLYKEVEKILYIYNHKRKQEALSWLSPVQFEQKWANHPNPPLMKLYDREAKKRTTRQRFF